MNAATPSSRYAVPVRALRRWAAENLTLAPQRDGSIEAVFRFEGGTCGNLPFALRYRMSLAPLPEGGWRIRALDCEPEDERGNQLQMCSARNSPGFLENALHGEKPLLGEPLDAALAWEPAVTPEGCLCAAPSRAHKWRAALQTLHYALNRSESP